MSLPSFLDEYYVMQNADPEDLGGVLIAEPTPGKEIDSHWESLEEQWDRGEEERWQREIDAEEDAFIADVERCEKAMEGDDGSLYYDDGMTPSEQYAAQLEVERFEEEREQEQLRLAEKQYREERERELKLEREKAERQRRLEMEAVRAEAERRREQANERRRAKAKERRRDQLAYERTLINVGNQALKKALKYV